MNSAQGNNEASSGTSALDDGLGFTLLTVKASEPFFDIRSCKTIHRINVTFARKSKVKISKANVEVCSQDIEVCSIDFHVGDSLGSFANGLRSLADTLDMTPNA